MTRSIVAWLLLALAASVPAEVAAATFPPVAVVNAYPERAPLNASNHGRLDLPQNVYQGQCRGRHWWPYPRL
jgi:hypothetical protein